MLSLSALLQALDRDVLTPVVAGQDLDRGRGDAGDARDDGQLGFNALEERLALLLEYPLTSGAIPNVTRLSGRRPRFTRETLTRLRRKSPAETASSRGRSGCGERGPEPRAERSR